MALKEIVSKLKNDNFKRTIIELVLLVLLFNVNKYLGLFLLVLVLLEMIFSKEPEILLYVFIFLSFNDEILKLDILKGSISRIVMVVIIIKLLFNIIKNKIKISISQICILLFFAVATIIGIIMHEGIFLSLISFLNIFIILLFSIVLRNGKTSIQFAVDTFIERLMRTIIISVLCGIIYGLFTVNFLRYIQDGEIVYRFNGSYEPNFMCMYINLAILSLMTIRKKFNVVIYYILMAFFININILTASMTGLITLLMSLIVYFFLHIKNWKTMIGNIGIIAIVTIVFFGCFKMVKVVDDRYYISFSQKLPNSTNAIIEELDGKINGNLENEIDEVDKLDDSYAMEHRFKRIRRMLNEGKIDEITSGRTALIRSFVSASFSRPIINILFGNGIVDQKVYSDFFDKNCLSHNSYIDFLYNFGVVGSLIVIMYLLYKTIKNNLLGVNINNSQYSKNIKLIRILLLIFAASLSFYTKRMFLMFFLL